MRARNHLRGVLVCVAALTVGLIPATASETWPMPTELSIIVRVPPGEEFPEERGAELVAALSNAVQWWDAQVDVVLPPVSQEVQVIPSTEEDAYGRPTFLYEGRGVMNIIWNVRSGKLAVDGTYSGGAWGRNAFIVATAQPWDVMMAHELGHTLFDLIDAYPACQRASWPYGPDIMCSNPRIAYATGFMGCFSSAYLKRPCKRTFFMQV